MYKKKYALLTLRKQFNNITSSFCLKPQVYLRLKIKPFLRKNLFFVTTLSVVIITLNEEKNIGRCLASVKEIADEIIVVDSFSTDRTEAICKEYGATFIQNPFKGHIEQKNFALDQATSDFILSLDADEALSDELKQEISLVKTSAANNSYSMNRLTNYCGQWIKHGSWYPDKKVRLIKHKTAKWGGVNPHDELIPENRNTIIHLKGDILHYSYYTLEEHIIQLNKFSSISAAAEFKSGKKSSWFKILFNPFYRFVRDYFLLSGWRDGFYGYIICRNNSYSTFLKYVKLKNLYKGKQP